jgi:GAF domain-containing protein
MISVELESLIGLIYEGALETQPWQSALPALREALDAQVASLILRPPTDGDKGVILNSLRPRSDGDAEERAKPDDWQLTIYREEFFALDPFLNLPPGQVISLEDILPDAELKASDYYLHYLKPIGLFRILGVDTLEPGGMLARLRFSRRTGEARFSEDDRKILKVIAPHLQRAIQIYAKLNRTTSERDLFAGAVDQLSVATIILDEQAQVANTNAIAESMLAEGDGISIQSKRLQVSGRDTNTRLQSALRAVIKAQKNPETWRQIKFRIGHSPHSKLPLERRPIQPLCRCLYQRSRLARRRIATSSGRVIGVDASRGKLSYTACSRS